VRKDFAAKSFLFVAAAAYSQLLCGLLGKYLLVSELYNPYIVRQVIFRLPFSAAESWMAVWVLRVSLFTQFLSMTISSRHISQGRVGTHLRCGGIFNYHFIANLSQGPKEAQVQSHLPDGANVHSFNRIHQVALMYLTTLCHELCKNSWMDWFTIWAVDAGGPKEAQVQSYSPGGANVPTWEFGAI